MVEYFTGPRAVCSEDDGIKRQANKGLRWTEEEDARVIEEFKAGMKMSEIAQRHGRTNGAIRSRLQMHGLVKV